MSWNDDVMNDFHDHDGTVDGTDRTIVIMHTVGARSGIVRPNPVTGLPDGASWLVTATAAGAQSDPGWAHNLRANPDIDLEVAFPEGGVGIVPVHAEELAEPTRTEVWPRFPAAKPVFNEYTTKTDRVFPVFRLSPRQSA